jgi:hypothetical protein
MFGRRAGFLTVCVGLPTRGNLEFCKRLLFSDGMKWLLAAFATHASCSKHEWRSMSGVLHVLCGLTISRSRLKAISFSLVKLPKREKLLSSRISCGYYDDT